MGSTYPVSTRTVIYTCGTDTVRKLVTIKPTPLPPTVSGIPDTLCGAIPDTLTGSPTGGKWYVGFTGTSPFVTIDSTTGALTDITTVAETGGVTTATVYSVHYVITNSYGCKDTANYTGNGVFPTVRAGVISGGATILCPGGTMALATTGDTLGTWSSSNPAIATVNPGNGLVTYRSTGTGTITISYILHGTCNSDTATYTIHTYDTISAGFISDPPAICAGSLLTMTAYGGAGSGTWSSSDPTVATLVSSGAYTATATGVGAGSATIYYTVSNACGTSTTPPVTLVVVPNPVISGATSVCQGLSTAPLTSTITGTWSSSNPAIAIINPTTGVVTGISGGTVTITCTETVSGSGCMGTYTFTVNPTPVIGVGINPNGAAPYPAVVCDNSIVLTAYGALSYTWSPGTSLYYISGSAYVTGTPATSVIVAGPLSAPITYTVTGTSAFGCVGTGTYTVVPPTCSGSFCTPFTGAPVYQLSGNIGTPGTTTIMPSGNYNVAANTIFFGNVQFANNVLAIAHGVSISVDATASLSFNHCHLYCCDRTQMWQGIKLNAATTSSGTLSLTNNTFVEDATVGVTINNGVIPASGTVLTCDGAIFNKNNTAIKITQFPATSSFTGSTSVNYPFLIRNCVFTSRKLENFVPASGTGWPMQWAAASGTSTALKATYSTTAFTPPFNIISPNGAGATGIRYPYQACNNGSIANMGINLSKVGEYQSSTTVANAPAIYAGIVIGDNSSYTGFNTYQNLFDTLYEGIYSNNSNVTCYNNAFIYIHTPVSTTGITNLTGDGIGAETVSPVLSGSTIVYPKYNIQVTGTSGGSAPTNNLFYDCIRGVTVNQYYNIDLSNSYIITHPSTTAIAAGQSGYNVISRRYRSVSMLNNTITNTRIGISLKSGTGGGTISQFAGNVDINYNTIQANPTGGSPGLGMAVTTGISVQNMFLTGSGAGSSAIGNVNTNNNTMNYVYNGINVNGYHFGQPLYSNNNTISVFNWAANVNPQYGISHVNCITNTINGNNITSQGYNLPIATITSTAAGKLTGIYASAVNGANITCNYTGDINVGFQFFSANLMNWFNNEMNRETVGMALNGTFGDQGSLTMPSNNVWRSTIPWWTGGNYNIFTWHSSTTWADTIYVDTNISTPTYYYDPINNSNSPYLIPRIYGGLTGSGQGLDVLSPTGTLPICLSPYSMYLKTIPAVTGTLGTGAAQQWIAQNGVWQMIKLDNSLTSSSPILAAFAARAVNTRHGWLTSIEDAIINGDVSTAQTLLSNNIDTYIDTTTDTLTGVAMKDGVGADYIVSNYVALYNNYTKFMDSAMTGNDSAQVLAIANLCPYTNGSIVYQAQAFYRVLFGDDTTQFNPNCDSAGARGANPNITSENTQQQYQLYPNPNDGSFMLRQMLSNTTTVAVMVKDVLGRSVYNQQVQFNNGTAQLQLSQLPTGIYILQITDAEQKISNFKFVIQK